jgi:hypothetical protein
MAACNPLPPHQLGSLDHLIRDFSPTPRGVIVAVVQWLQMHLSAVTAQEHLVSLEIDAVEPHHLVNAIAPHGVGGSGRMCME